MKFRRKHKERKSPDYLRFCILLSMTGWGRRYCKLSRPITKGTKKRNNRPRINLGPQMEIVVLKLVIA